MSTIQSASRYNPASNANVQNFDEGVDNTSNPPQHIVALTQDHGTGKTQWFGHQGTQGPPAPPSQVRENLKQVEDYLPMDMSAILIAVNKINQEIRKACVLVRDMGFQAQFEELSKSAEDMLTGADLRRFAALAQSATSMSTAGAQLYGSAQAANEMMKSVNPQMEGKALEAQATSLNAQAAQLESQAMEMRSAPPAATNDSVNAADNTATSIEKDIAAREQALTDDGWELLDQKQIQQDIAREEQALKDDGLEVLEQKQIQQEIDGNEKSGIDNGAEVVSPDEFKAEDEKTTSTAPRTPEQLEKEASELRSRAESLKAEAAVKFEQVKEINDKANDIKNTWDLVGKALDAAGQALTAWKKFDAEVADVSAKKHEASAKQLESESARLNDAIQSAREISQDALQKLEAIEQARHETNRAIQRNMG